MPLLVDNSNVTKNCVSWDHIYLTLSGIIFFKEAKAGTSGTTITGVKRHVFFQ